MTLRAIALDVDGTVLTPAFHVAPATCAAIASARAAGVCVILASARGPRGLAPVLAEARPGGPLVCYGGALVTHGSDVLFERPLDHASALATVDLAAALELEVAWYSGDRWFAERTGPGLERTARINREQPAEIGAFAARSAPHKVLCIGSGAQAARRLHELRTLLPPGCVAHFSHPHFLEVTGAGVDKALGLAAALDALGITLDECAAIGDGENDIVMLRAAGVGIAMGHAAPAVQAAADWTTESNDRDGVALAITRLVSEARLPAVS
jgi:Cof subfamily protein (haloacid dehalogenase superfamily)